MQECASAVLYAELESEEALKAYAPHPAHEDFKKLPEPYKTGALPPSL